MKLRTAFITRSPEHVADMTHRLMMGLAPSWLTDATNPVLISLIGNTSAEERRMVAHAARDLFLPQDRDFLGKANRREIWSGMHSDNPIEIDFLDSGMLGGGEKFSREMEFIDQRKTGGVTFVSGASQRIMDGSDIQIYIEEAENLPNDYDQTMGSPYASSSLKMAFTRMTSQDSDTRFVQITIPNESLMKYRDFRTTLESLSLGPLKKTLMQRFRDNIAFFTNSDFDAPAPIYGINIPQQLAPKF